MGYHGTYRTPEGFTDMTMFSDGDALTGLLFNGSRDLALQADASAERELPVFRTTRRWLDAYFKGQPLDFTPPYRLYDLTPFRKEVLQEVRKIPFGHTATYGTIARIIAKRQGRSHMSAQAVGGAVGWNPLCLVIPCHRVMGAGNRLTGYGGGLENKIALLKHEGLSL